MQSRCIKSLGGGWIWSNDLNDKARENIIRIMNMRVSLDDIRVAALVADCVQSLAFSDNIYLVAGPPEV